MYGEREKEVKKIALFLMVASIIALAASCGGSAAATKLKVGMVTDAGTIDDKSFNQGTAGSSLRSNREGLEGSSPSLGVPPERAMKNG
jgi:basic membrane protein A